MKQIFLLLAIFILASSSSAQRQMGVRPTETGGPLRFEQAVYDVHSYDISLDVDPATKSIKGSTVIKAKIVIPTNVILLDLDTPYKVEMVREDGVDRKYEFKDGKIWIWFPMTKQVGEVAAITVAYSGVPRVAPMPPWIGGFMWKKTPS